MVGEHKHPRVPMDRVLAHELEIAGSHGIQAHRYPDLLAMIRAGRLQPGELVGRTVSLEEAVERLCGLDRSTDTGVTVIDSF